MDIVIIAHFCDALIENTNNRFDYLVDLFRKNNHEVELITSNFSHRDKKHREQSIQKGLTLIKEPGYVKNVSIKRFYSHFIAGKNLKKYLYTRKKPDIIYCAVPSLDFANEACKYAKSNGIKFVIDVQDLWPEAFKMVFNIPVISNIIYYPMEKYANRIYRLADEVVAVSQTYVDRVLHVNHKVSGGHAIFLGTEIKKFDQIAKKNIIRKPVGEFWVIYIGTLGHSYDIPSVIDALEEIKKSGIEDIKFLILGDGPLKKEFHEYSKKSSINIEFKGLLKYEEMIGYLLESDIAVNPIRKGAAGSIINKVGDYAAAGLPVVNTQECEEYRNLIESYNCGINCNSYDVEELKQCILRLYDNEIIRINMGRNNRRLAEDRFDRLKTYQNIVDVLSK